jgi:hypothetical protein
MFRQVRTHIEIKTSTSGVSTLLDEVASSLDDASKGWLADDIGIGISIGKKPLPLGVLVA